MLIDLNCFYSNIFESLKAKILKISKRGGFSLRFRLMLPESGPCPSSKFLQRTGKHNIEEGRLVAMKTRASVVRCSRKKFENFWFRETWKKKKLIQIVTIWFFAYFKGLCYFLKVGLHSIRFSYVFCTYGKRIRFFLRTYMLTVYAHPFFCRPDKSASANFTYASNRAWLYFCPLPYVSVG